MKRINRYRQLDVSVDVGDVLDQLEDEELAAELRARRCGVPEELGSDWFDRLRWYVMREDKNGALAMLDSLLPRMRGHEAKETTWMERQSPAPEATRTMQ